MKKRTALTIIATSLTVATIGTTTAFTNRSNSNNTFYKLASGDGTYQFTLTSSESFAGVSKNMTVGSGTTYTTLGNEVYWEYLYGYADSNFITLDEGGYLTNTSDIWGINKITITANQDIKYISNEEERTITSGSGEITLTPTDSFTLMSLTDGTSITSLTVKYSCSSVGGLYTYRDDSTYYTITEVNNKALSTYVVPSTYNGKPVVMDEDIFVGCDSMVNLCIPSLNEHVFKYYFNDNDYNVPTSLRNVTVKDGSIPASAFKYSSRQYSITNITLLNEGSIGSRAFDSITTLSNVYIGGGITSIGQYAFNSDTSLTTTFIPVSVISMDKLVFQGCSNLTTIRCETNELVDGKPSGWVANWSGCSATVTWGATR